MASENSATDGQRQLRRSARVAAMPKPEVKPEVKPKPKPKPKSKSKSKSKSVPKSDNPNDTASGAKPAGIHDSTKSDAAAAPIRRPVRDPDQVIPDSQESLFSAPVQQPIRDPHQVIQDSQDRSSSEGIIHGQEILAGIEPTQPVAQEALSQVTVDLHQMPLGHIVAIQTEPEQDPPQAVHDTDMADVESTKPTSLSPSPTGPVVQVADEPVEAFEDVQDPPPIWDESTDASDGMQIDDPDVVGNVRTDHDGGDVAISDDASDRQAHEDRSAADGHDDPAVDDPEFEPGQWSGYESDHSDESDLPDEELNVDDYELHGCRLIDADEEDVYEDDGEDDAEDPVPGSDDLSRRVPVNQRILEVPDEKSMRRLGMLPPTGSRFDPDAAQRFETIFFSFFHELTLECMLLQDSLHGMEYLRSDEDQRPVAYSVSAWVNRNVGERGERAVAEELLQYIPNIVRSVLGRTRLTPWDMLDLPVIVPELELFGVYVNIPLGPDVADTASYVGCATSRTRGIVGRVRTHLNISRKSTLSPEFQNSVHYRHTIKDGVSCNFRVLSLAPMGWRGVSTQGMLEGVFAAILNTFAENLPIGHKYNVKVSYEWVVCLRKMASAACGESFPDLASSRSSHGLNVLSPFRQGIRATAMCGSGLPAPEVIERCGDCGREVPDTFQGRWEDISGQHVAKIDRWAAAVMPGDVIGVICGRCWKSRVADAKLTNFERWRKHPDRTESDLEADEYCSWCKEPRRATGRYIGRGKNLTCQTCWVVLVKADKRGRDRAEYFKGHRFIQKVPVERAKRTWSDRTEATASQKEADPYCCRCGLKRIKGMVGDWRYRGKKSICHRCGRAIAKYMTINKTHRSQILRKIWEDREGAKLMGTAWEHGQEPDDFITQALSRAGISLPGKKSRNFSRLDRSKSEEEAHDKCWNCGAARDERFRFQGKCSTCSRCIRVMEMARKDEGYATNLDLVKDYLAKGKRLPAPNEHGLATLKNWAAAKAAKRTKSWEEADGVCWSCGALRPTTGTALEMRSFHFQGKDCLCRSCYERAKKEKQAEDEEYLRVHGSPRRPNPTVLTWTRKAREAGRQDFRRRADDSRSPTPIPISKKARNVAASEEAIHDRCFRCGELRKNGELWPTTGRNSMCKPCTNWMRRVRVAPRTAKIPDGLSHKDHRAAVAEIYQSVRDEIRAEVAAEAQAKLEEGRHDDAPATEPSPVPTPADMTPAALVTPATTTRAGQGSRSAWSPMDDFEPVRTSASGLLCAIHAIRRSIHFQMPGIREVPTVEDLQSLFVRLQTRQTTSSHMAAFAPYEDLANFADLLTNEENLGIDQATWIFRTWARENGHHVRLGVVYPYQGSHLHYTPPLEEDDEAGEEAPAIWIYSNDEGDVDGGMGHWSGMKPRN